LANHVLECRTIEAPAASSRKEREKKMVKVKLLGLRFCETFWIDNRLLYRKKIEKAKKTKCRCSKKSELAVAKEESK
jgi:hypothetical protein